MSAYEALMAFQRQTEALSQMAAVWAGIRRPMMPRGAAEQRAEETGAIQAVIHARRSDPRLGEWLSQAEAPDAVAAAQLRHIRRDHARATRVPGDLAEALARLTSRAQGIWAEARAADDFAAFAPVLEEVRDPQAPRGRGAGRWRRHL